MKKLILFTVIFFFAGVSFGQSLQKGNLVGVHVLKLKLQPDVTYNQWKDYFLNKYIPEAEKIAQGDVKFYLTESIRGVNKHEVGYIVVFRTEAIRDKYNKDDGSLTEYGEQFMKKFEPLIQELAKYEKFRSTTYNDWIVQ
jgi:hypothetical protein